MFINKILKLAYSKADLITVFIIVAIFNINSLLSNCSLITNTGFDSQALFIWQYSAEKNFLPFKDVFYPYGLLTYLRDQNFLLHLVYFLLVPTILVIIYYIFKRIFKNNYISLFSLIIFFMAIYYYSGFDSLIRYGITPAFLLLFSLFVFADKKPNSFYIIWGIVSGITYSFFIDQGIYLVICLLFSILLISLSNHKKIVEIFRQELFLIIGFIIGIIPLLVYLVKYGILTDFFKQLSFLPQLFLIAKIPFPPSLRSADNIFTITLLLFSFSYLTITYLIKGKKLDIRSFMLANLTFLLIVVEQKNIMRSISKDLFVYGLLILNLSASIFLKKAWHVYVYSIILILIVFFVCQGNSQGNELFSRTNSNNCIDINSERILNENNNYSKVVNYFKKKTNPIVFSTPSDPAFFVLLRQMPPYYPEIYDGQLNGVQKRTNYIINNKIQYVIYNTSSLSIQDGVPDYLRASDEFAYIFNNFVPEKMIGNFIILKKASIVSDFFNNEVINNSKIKSFFLNVDLGSIPLSEGQYKKIYLKNSDIVFSKEIYLSKKEKLKALSKNKLLVLVPTINNSERTNIKVSTSDFKMSSISFNPCKVNDACIIDLSKIPLLYKERVITGFEISNFQGTAKIYNSSNITAFW